MQYESAALHPNFMFKSTDGPVGNIGPTCKILAGPSGPPHDYTAVHGHGTPTPIGEKKTFSTGAQRQAGVAGDCGKGLTPRYDLLSPLALRRLAETYAEGALKYNDHNWRAGMPFSDTLNHCMAHINQYLMGDTTEDHLAHAAWNLFALMHFEQTHPEMNDLKVDDYGTNKPV